MSTKPAVLPSALPAQAQPKFAISPDWKTTACMFTADAFALSLVFSVLVLARYSITSSYKLAAGLQFLPCLAILLIAFWAQGLYPGVLFHPADEMRRIYTSISIVFLGVASTTFSWRSAESYSIRMLLLAWLTAPPAVLLARYLTRRHCAAKSWWGVATVVLGSGPTAQKVLNTLKDGTLGVRVTGVLTSERMLSWSFNSPFAVADSWNHCMGSESRRARYAIVAMPERLAVELRHAIQYYTKGFSHVILIPEFSGLGSLGLSALDIGGAFGVEMPQRLFHRSSAAFKRVMDLVLAGLGILLISPLLLFIAVAIRAVSKGPILYRHVRVGRNGQSINALKFRTMVMNADAILKDHFAGNPEAQIEWRRTHKLKNDPRVIPMGKWLRRFSLDELPQLWNVIRGDMSLVGPRPIVKSEIEKYGRGYELYTRVRPGITGLWQVSGRNNTTYEERVSFDEYYVRNWSGWLDAYLLVRTIKAVMTADGAY